MTQIQKINEIINRELGDEATVRALLATTFPGFDLKLMKQALLEGMVRGWDFEDFLKKRVYAIKYGDKYTLVASIDHCRVVAQKMGVWTSTPEFTYVENGELESCTVVAKKRIGEDIAEYGAKVFFKEFSTSRNLWLTKPAAMLAKVAEMHALRKACPEELEKAYVEEEMNGGVIDAIDTDTQTDINSLKTIEELEVYYADNKGKGKAFDKAIISRKRELEATNKETK